ncbi:MAG: TlpA family protein disulfide reductase [Deltaproteobacteria bacterium]|nr:TlpA family protein disulfide reductase [Deltaproteobacteria bacterium]
MNYIAVFCMICAMLGCSEAPPVTVGSCTELFSDVPFTDLEGREARLPCQGHTVLVVSFWASWCGPCKLEVPHLIEIDTEYHRQGVRVIGISLDAAIPTTVKSAVAAFGITYPVLVGGAEKIFNRTGIDGIPATLIIDADGKVCQRLVGYHTKEEMVAPITELLKKTRENAQL